MGSEARSRSGAGALGHVQLVETDEIRVSIAETYDVIVEPKSNQAYTVFAAEAIDRSGYARGTLTGDFWPLQGQPGKNDRISKRTVSVKGSGHPT